METKGKNFLNEGDLLLRTPLPSGILFKYDLENNFNIFIPDTTKALGFQKTIVLTPSNIVILPPNEYGYKSFVSGVFHIPTQKDWDLKWLKLIPNSSCVLKGFSIHSPDGKNNKGEILLKGESQDKKIFKRIFSFFKR